MPGTDDLVRLRPLERDDLPFVHQMDNNASVMRYWFEEPYEAFVELCDLYDKHIHDQSERRFIIEHAGTRVGLVELVEIDYVHRRAEFQIIRITSYNVCYTKLLRVSRSMCGRELRGKVITGIRDRSSSWSFRPGSLRRGLPSQTSGYAPSGRFSMSGLETWPIRKRNNFV